MASTSTHVVKVKIEFGIDSATALALKALGWTPPDGEAEQGDHSDFTPLCDARTSLRGEVGR